ncbi:Phosphoadenylyl-sulfate reductase / Adenylyl-sulfate reductase (thioredoxin) [Roseibacterium elongatum DSM 19469]|uniref:Adenosine 5'-phosphosulfate reductase n=1 Tax=Roseicyclus elongatus DSM 19469 TaxID=1294273 RepID=W8S0Q5_9RHOB|nr:phosphoadenylyl-sulfate reductase [Roseibacterium elongatum]AHM03737.1 Phosphoadenylyl-sulfate reductase / Adenylyl-sulfate reductase (thioredoxin) [Roseibacterium elongatum DSM 19469]
MSAEGYPPPSIPDSWPPGGVDAALSRLQQRYLPSLSSMDILGLLRDPALGRRGVVASFGAESAVLMHYVSSALPGISVIFLDTGMHFDETLAYRKELESRLDIDVIDVRPDTAAVAGDDPDGSLHLRDPDACCRLRKTFPLQDALVPFDAWITGRKRAQGGARAALPVIERDGARIKINPLAHWSSADIAAYFRAHDLPHHPLTQKGYPSIGCAPCTRRVRKGEDPRAGRWPQMPDKVECGIHLGPDGRIVRARNTGQ